jgi:hypothetical protein
MSRDAIIELIRANRAKLDELNVKSLAIFGSVARGDDRPDSDLDVLVEFEGDITWKRYIALKRYIETLTGRQADITARDTVPPQSLVVLEKELLLVA